MGRLPGEVFGGRMRGVVRSWERIVRVWINMYITMAQSVVLIDLIMGWFWAS